MKTFVLLTLPGEVESVNAVVDALPLNVSTVMLPATAPKLAEIHSFGVVVFSATNVVPDDPTLIV